MRTLRTLIGLGLVLAGAPMIFASGIGWTALQHRDDSGGFSATLAQVHTDGYAIIVPDLGAVVGRHWAAAALRTGEFRITVGSASSPVLLATAPSTDAIRYVDGVSRTELTGVGLADGAQPVAVVDLTGPRTLAPARRQVFWRALDEQSVTWDRATSERTALMIMRADGEPGFGVTLAAETSLSWLGTVTWVLLLLGVITLLAGLGVLFGPDRAREALLVVETQRMVAFADRIAETLSGRWRMTPRTDGQQCPAAESQTETPAGAQTETPVGAQTETPAKPGATKPGTTKPGTTKPGVARSGAVQPGAVTSVSVGQRRDSQRRDSGQRADDESSQVHLTG